MVLRTFFETVFSVIILSLDFHSLKHVSHHDHKKTSFTILQFADIKDMFCPDNTFYKNSWCPTLMLSYPAPPLDCMGGLSKHLQQCKHRIKTKLLTEVWLCWLSCKWSSSYCQKVFLGGLHIGLTPYVMSSCHSSLEYNLYLCTFVQGLTWANICSSGAA